MKKLSVMSAGAKQDFAMSESVCAAEIVQLMRCRCKVISSVTGLLERIMGIVLLLYLTLYLVKLQF